MAQPSLEFLCLCIATALLDYYRVVQLPVPLGNILRTPPPDLANDLGLIEGLPFGQALWVRPFGGRGAVFVNATLSEPVKRYAMARALFTGLCFTQGGRALGLPEVPNDHLNEQSALFARYLLMPEALLPPGWERMPPQELAQLCRVPVEVAEAHLAQVAGRRSALSAEPGDSGPAAGEGPRSPVGHSALRY